MSPHADDKRIGETIQHYREIHEISVIEATRRLANMGCGFGPATLYAIECGRRPVKLREAPAFAAVFGVEVGELAYGRDE